MRRGWERLEVHERKCLECLEESVARNVNVTGAFGEASGGNEETGGEGPYYKAVEDLAQSRFGSIPFCGMESRPSTNELGYLVEDIFKQSFKGTTWLLLAAYNNMQEEREEVQLEDLKNTQPTHIANKDGMLW